LGSHELWYITSIAIAKATHNRVTAIARDRVSNSNHNVVTNLDINVATEVDS